MGEPTGYWPTLLFDRRVLDFNTGNYALGLKAEQVLSSERQRLLPENLPQTDQLD
jgi:hypothetical protein